LIPPGAQVPGASTASSADDGDDTASESESTDAAEETSAETTAAGLADNCKAGDYTIEAGDTPIGVAGKFDVTVDQLNAANASTNGYGAFYVGLVIVIPEKDCE
jgi:LysM repeat protein